MSRWNTSVWSAGLAAVVGVALASPPENLFGGSWAGTYQLPSLGGGGTAEFNISNNGVVDGTTINNDGTVHTLVGRIDNDGWIVGVATFENHGPAEFFSGQCVVDGCLWDDRFSGSASQACTSLH